MYNALDWYNIQEKNEFPVLLRGDICFSYCHGSLISSLINRFQGRGKHVPLSHVSLYIGLGNIAEATVPHGGVVSLKKYFNKSYNLIIVRIPEWDTKFRDGMVSEMCRLAPRNYDKLNIFRHLVDNIIERITWNIATQTGYRPLARLIKDRDGNWQNVCSEILEWSYERMTRPPGKEKIEGSGLNMQLDSRNMPGTARPIDQWQWCFTPFKDPADGLIRQRGRVIFEHRKLELIIPVEV